MQEADRRAEGRHFAEGPATSVAGASGRHLAATEPVVAATGPVVAATEPALSREPGAGSYARRRAWRRRRRMIRSLVSTLLAVALLGLGTAIAAYKLVLEPRWDAQLGTAVDGTITDFSSGVWDGSIAPLGDLREPFWMLLLGLDDNGDGSLPRTDTMILAYIDAGQRRVVLISIPRDLRVMLPGYGHVKINAAYTYGELEHVNYQAGLRDTDNSGPALAMRTVSELAGVGIARFAVIDFAGFHGLVDALGGVYVDVPVRIDDPEAGPAVIEVGPQVLNGEQALTFVRSRNFGVGDYQRQANQRTFLQALARQSLSSPASLFTAASRITEMTYSNLSTSEILSLGLSFYGLSESEIHTYTTPAYSQFIDGSSYELLDVDKWQGLVGSIAAGGLPDPAELGLNGELLGVTPEGY